MASALRKIALLVTLPVVAVLIAANAYVVANNLKRIQETTGNRVAAIVIQADIGNVLLDLDEMETGQRGYLLTGDPSYLQPYSEAKATLTAHFSVLRSRLAAHSYPQERSLQAKLEAVTEAKIAEMEETIRLRQQGYRHRAFVLVDSNRGKELMDEARTTLNALSSAQTRNVAAYDRELNESVRRAYKQSALTNLILLLVTVVTLAAFNWYSRRRETQCARLSEQLRAASIQLERLTSAVSNDFRALVGQTRTHANALLSSYGGFLPRQGQEQAESIEDSARRMDRLLDDLFEEAQPGSSDEITEAQHTEKLIA